MDKLVEMGFKSFESFIKRAVVPSSSFLFIFAALYLWLGSCYDREYVEWVKAQFVFEWYVYAMIFVGLSYFLSILQQALIDNLLKGDFSDDKGFVWLRNDVIKKLKEKKPELSSKEDVFFVDYALYELLGKETDTKNYVDDAKAIGIFVVSLILNLLIMCLMVKTPPFYGLSLLAGFIVWLIGRYLTKQRYKSRAVRLYINYLYGDVQSGNRNSAS